jgi:hypothetical protein
MGQTYPAWKNLPEPPIFVKRKAPDCLLIFLMVVLQAVATCGIRARHDRSSRPARHCFDGGILVLHPALAVDVARVSKDRSAGERLLSAGPDQRDDRDGNLPDTERDLTPDQIMTCGMTFLG